MTNDMLSSEIFWLFLGVALILMEIFAVMPGIGLLFAGLGALCTALLLYNIPEYAISLAGQVVWFLAFGAFWAAVLWKPMKKWRLSSGSSQTYNDMIGQEVTITGSDLTKERMGQVLWSGTVMNARLVPEDMQDALPVGSLAVIAIVEGNTLIVKSPASHHHSNV
jgi:membrane protein implicated in regulation of membrane protease activity